jgi:hypothetical protein
MEVKHAKIYFECKVSCFFTIKVVSNFKSIFILTSTFLMCNFWKLAWLKTSKYLLFPLIPLNKNSIFMNLPMYISHFSKENKISSNKIKHFNNKVSYHNPFHVFRWFSKLGCILYVPSNFMTLNVSCKTNIVHLFCTYNWLCVGEACLNYVLSLEGIQNIVSFILCLYWYGGETNHQQLGNLQKRWYHKTLCESP